MTVAHPFVPPDVSDAPFRPPLDAVIDLPFPPSVNRIWRSQRHANGQTIGVRRSPEYQRWLKEADMAVIAARTYSTTPKIGGAFEAEILLSRRYRRGDLDNRAKAVLDWAQARAFIKNDSLCESLTIRWVDPDNAPHGARLIVRPCE